MSGRGISKRLKGLACIFLLIGVTLIGVILVFFRYFLIFLFYYPVLSITCLFIVCIMVLVVFFKKRPSSE